MNPQLNSLLTSGLETALRQVIALDAAAPSQLQQLNGKNFAIDLNDMKLSFYFLFRGEEVLVQSQWEGEVDARLKGKSGDFFQMLGDEHQGDSIMRGNIHFEGDIGSAQQFQRFWQGLHPDWEAPLASLFGDQFAYRTGRAVRELGQWLQQAASTLRLNTTEYLQEEHRSLPPRVEVENFYADVAELRSRLDRGEARLRKLKQKLAP